MDNISPAELDGVETGLLVARMDKILSSIYWGKMERENMKLNVDSVYGSVAVKKCAGGIQRKIVYKTFGLLLQLRYTELSMTPASHPAEEHDEPEARHLYFAARTQWFVISSRILFEYFIHLTYMLGNNGTELCAKKSSINKYKQWMKTPDNPYTYFALSASRALKYSREKRDSEVHASTKLARKLLLSTANDIDSEIFKLVNIIKNQWQYLLEIINDKKPNGWNTSGYDAGDNEWYELWGTGNHGEIVRAIDVMFGDSSS